MAHFYLSDNLAGVSEGDNVALGSSESRHIVTVSRTRAGDAILLGNGRGVTVGGTVTAADPAGVVVRVERVENTARNRQLVMLVQALAKGGRDELAVQAATELGVDAVIPWSAERSVARWDGAKATKGRDRWQSITREATKQSMRAWLPDVRPIASTSVLTESASDMRMLVLEPTAKTRLTGITPDGRDLAIVVGPEGGVSPRELEAFEAAGAEPVRLGSGVLRTSTAGPAALAVINMILGRW
jgi:16S rRNA (uracil1498-N3)-methyltransferase